MGRIEFLLLALFAEMKRTFTAERAAHARSVAEAVAASGGLQLFRYLEGPNALVPPVPMMNVLTAPRRARPGSSRSHRPARRGSRPPPRCRSRRGRSAVQRWCAERDDLGGHAPTQPQLTRCANEFSGGQFAGITVDQRCRARALPR
jgi:hypothetical protein